MARAGRDLGSGARERLVLWGQILRVNVPASSINYCPESVFTAPYAPFRNFLAHSSAHSPSEKSAHHQEASPHPHPPP